MAVHPSLASTPQLLEGGAIPRPIKLSVDSANIATGMRKVRVMMSAPVILGRISLHNMRV